MTDSMAKLKNLTKRLKIAPPRTRHTTSKTPSKTSTSSTFCYPAQSTFLSPSPTSNEKPNFDDVFMTSPKRRLSSTRSVPLTSPARKHGIRDGEQIGSMQRKLDEITAELLAMKRADEDLARKLMKIHADIHALKVSHHYVKNGEVLDEAIHEAEIAGSAPRISDEPRKVLNAVLQQRGVTRMNLWTRRFSCA